MKDRTSRPRVNYAGAHEKDAVQWRYDPAQACARARKENKPLFITDGFAGCHWCHRLAAESFGPGPLADLINTHCVPLLIDRQVRPDWDSFLMACSQAQGAAGGWPLMALCDPDGRPFWTGGYLPLQSRPGLTGLWETLTTLIDYWQGDESGMRVAAAALAGWVGETPPRHPAVPKALTSDECASAVELTIEADGRRAPSFMQPLRFLLLEAVGRGERAASLALDLCHRPIVDPLGGVFRYATQTEWAVPHYEKNAGLSGLWALCCARLSVFEPLLADFARSSVRWIWDELWQDGALAFGTDADSNGIEGAHYLISREEFEVLCGSFSAFTWVKGLPVAQDGLENHRAVLDRLGAQRTAPLAVDPGARPGDGLCCALAFEAMAALDRDSLWLERAFQVFRWAREIPVLTYDDRAALAFARWHFEGGAAADLLAELESCRTERRPAGAGYPPAVPPPAAGGELPGGPEWEALLALASGEKAPDNLIRILEDSWVPWAHMTAALLKEGVQWTFGK